MRILILIALAGCGIGGGAGVDLTFLDDVGFGFGEVFVCTPQDQSARLELCWGDDDPDALAASLDDAKGSAWTCEATPRHLGPCLYSCPTPSSGCNAYEGCWCP